MQVCKCLTQSNQILNSLHPSNSQQQSLCEHGECNFLLNSKRASACYEFLHLQTYKWSISSTILRWVLHVRKGNWDNVLTRFS